MNKNGAHWPEPPADDDDDLEEDMPQHASSGAGIRFQLEQRNGSMAYCHVGPKDSEPQWVTVCDFILLEKAALYMFIEDGAGPPYIKLICRSIIDPDGQGVALLKVDDVNRTPSTRGLWALDIEVLVQPGKLRTSADVKGMFQSAHVRLNATTMTPDMLCCWMGEQPQPDVTSCIVRFGRQRDNSWVSGNCAWREQRLLSHAEAGIAVIPSLFLDSVLPMPMTDFPRNIIIPQCHVRYYIQLQFWNEVLPSFFLNNTIQARAVFALGVAQLYATKLWEGESGVGQGCPFGWLYSREPSTGKTKSMLAVNSMLGFYSRTPAAGDITKPAIFERLNQQTDIAVTIDDVVVRFFYLLFDGEPPPPYGTS